MQHSQNVRPPFSLEKIKKQSAGSIIYQLNKPLANGQTQLRLTSLELIDKLASLVPPPRIHRHRYYGVLAPNSPFRASVTAMAGLSLAHGAIEIQTTDKNDEPVEQEPENKPKRPPSRDDYNQDMSIAESEQSTPDFEFNQCVSW